MPPPPNPPNVDLYSDLHADLHIGLHADLHRANLYATTLISTAPPASSPHHHASLTPVSTSGLRLHCYKERTRENERELDVEEVEKWERDVGDEETKWEIARGEKIS